MNFKILSFALDSILIRKYRNIAIFISLFISLFLLSSTLFIASSIKKTISLEIASQPNLVVQRVVGGRLALIDEKRLEFLGSIRGVTRAEGRVWGYYFFSHPAFSNGGINITLYGVDTYIDDLNPEAKSVSYEFFDMLESGGGAVGERLKEALEKGYFKEYFNLYTPESEIIKVPINKVFSANEFPSLSDTLVLKREIAAEVLGVGDTQFTDIALEVKNPEELDTIVSKIIQKYPDVRVIDKEDLESIYAGVVDYKGGFFLVLFLLFTLSLFLIIYEKASGLGASEKKEIAILKALGWSIADIMKLKFYEHSIVVSLSLLCSFFASFVFVYFLEAPLLVDIFSGSSELKASFVAQKSEALYYMPALFVAVFIIYISIVLIPVYKSAALDSESGLKGVA
ncbi:MAG: FtsX-like permease family protein [Campylobacterales bacterium]